MYPGNVVTWLALVSVAGVAGSPPTPVLAGPQARSIPAAARASQLPADSPPTEPNGPRIVLLSTEHAGLQPEDLERSSALLEAMKQSRQFPEWAKTKLLFYAHPMRRNALDKPYPAAKLSIFDTLRRNGADPAKVRDRLQQGDDYGEFAGSLAFRLPPLSSSTIESSPARAIENVQGQNCLIVAFDDIITNSARMDIILRGDSRRLEGKTFDARQPYRVFWRGDAVTENQLLIDGFFDFHGQNWDPTSLASREVSRTPIPGSNARAIRERITVAVSPLAIPDLARTYAKSELLFFWEPTALSSREFGRMGYYDYGFTDMFLDSIANHVAYAFVSRERGKRNLEVVEGSGNPVLRVGLENPLSRPITLSIWIAGISTPSASGVLLKSPKQGVRIELGPREARSHDFEIRSTTNGHQRIRNEIKEGRPVLAARLMWD